jgi:8-oxo-dGTP diphosphatase
VLTVYRILSARDVVAGMWARVPITLRRRLVWLSQATFTVGVSGVVLNDRDEVLLLRHRFREKGGWELPGGLVGRSERLEDGLRRELKEETGYDVEVLGLVSTEIATFLHLDTCFVARVRSGELIVNETEVVEARFFAYDDLDGVFDDDQLSGIDLALARLSRA